MKYFKSILILLLSITLSNCEYKDNFFRVGQIWSYDTRQGESNSTLTIVSVENDKNYGVIVGAFINNIKIVDFGEGGNIKFIPFSKEALKNSVTRIKGFSNNLPDYRDSYKKWRKLFDAKGCKIINLPVKQAIDTLQININKK